MMARAVAVVVALALSLGVGACRTIPPHTVAPQRPAAMHRLGGVPMTWPT
jgi:hypothetical protein